MRSVRIDVSEYIRPIGILNKHNVVRSAGTGFGFHKPGLVLTAAHVVAAASRPNAIHLQMKSGRFLRARSVKAYPKADVAVLTFDANQSPPYFRLGEPPKQIGKFYLGTEVLSYGYPLKKEGSGKGRLEPRLMSGYIQRIIKYEQEKYSYHAFEPSFPTIPGQSGSPILLKDDIDYAIAVLTRNFESSTEIDSYEEHLEDGEKEIHKIIKVVSYGIGTALWPLKHWISSS